MSSHFNKELKYGHQPNKTPGKTPFYPLPHSARASLLVAKKFSGASLPFW
jgi:hypothetical protein